MLTSDSSLLRSYQNITTARKESGAVVQVMRGAGDKPTSAGLAGRHRAGEPPPHGGGGSGAPSSRIPRTAHHHSIWGVI